MVWQLIIGTRSIAGLFFKDLPGLIKIHSFLGKYGTILVFTHPIFYILSQKLSLTYLFSIQIGEGYERYVTFGRLAFFALAGIWLTSAIVRSSIKYRPWKYIHYLSYPALGFSLLHVPDIGNSVTESGVRFMWLAMVATSLIAVALRMRHLFGYGKMQFELVDKNQVSPNVFQFQLRPIEGTFRIGRGQYIYIQKKLWGEEHPFSVLDFDESAGQILITFKVFGKFTQKLAQTQIGELVYVDGPYGIFTHESYELGEKPRIFIAGGIGITPFLRHILDKNGPETHLFYANQTPESATYRATLQKMLGKRYIDVFSKSNIENSQNIESGYISQEIIHKYIIRPESYQYFICGPEGMIEVSESALASLGVPSSQIFSEKFQF